MTGKTEVEEVLEKIDIVAKELKITRKEAMLLVIAHQLVCIHYHIDEEVNKWTRKQQLQQ